MLLCVTIYTNFSLWTNHIELKWDRKIDKNDKEKHNDY